MSRYSCEDWTLGRYGELIDAARKGRSFEPFGTLCSDPHVLWRHDIDYSLAHAMSHARIEADQNVRATYFVMLGSPYYNLLEVASLRQLRELRSMGHWIGLHFDPERYSNFNAVSLLEDAMRRERMILAEASAGNVDSISLHNPAFAGLLHMDADHLAGMINVYSAKHREAYVYCSDSFGFWRHKPIHEVVADPGLRQLHVLTHPVWWWEKPMGSRARIRACVDNHARQLYGLHDDLLARAGQIESVLEADKSRGFYDPPSP